jgi:hypothetical protein
MPNKPIEPRPAVARRMRELATELQSRRQTIVDSILAGLNRPVSELDRISAGHIATDVETPASEPRSAGGAT